MESMTRAFEVNLRALSLLALLVGVFLVYDTITFTVVQRRALWGTLRALGVTRGEVLRVVCFEAFLIGATGTLLGLVMGIGLAQVLVKLVTQSINDLYFVVNVRELAIEPSVLLQCAVLGVAATLVGAIVPAREATQTQPRTALDRSVPESSMRRRLLPLSLAGVAIAASMLALLGLSSTSLELAFVALLGTLVGAALLVPAATVLACRVATPLFGAIGGQLGRVAARGVSSHLARTAVAIAALAISLSATAGMGIMVSSFRGTVTQWLGRQLAADIYISAQHTASSRDRGALAPELVERLRSHAAVVASNGFRDFVLDAEDGTMLNASAADLAPQGRAAYLFLRGEPAQVWTAFDTRDAFIVSESLARHRGLDVGGTLRVRTASGTRAFEVAGVFRDYSSDRGLALMSPATARGNFGDGPLSAIGLFLAPGSDSQGVVASLRALVRPGEVVRISSRDALLAASLEIFDRTFEVTRVMRLLACTVAFLGVLCSLLAIELEREREFGVLRAVGLTPGELRAVVLGQTGLMGAIAGLIALPIGIALSLILIFSINARAFGWTLELAIPPSVLFETLALAIGAAMLAGIWPAWRMSRVAPARALRAD
jgi:putative ABC transport system permease protein